MKVVLINPNHFWLAEKLSYITDSHLNLRKINPPLGLASIASIIREMHDVKIIEANALNLSFEKVVEIVNKLKPDVIGITSFFATTNGVNKLRKLLMDVDAKFYVGGAGPTAEPEKYVDNFDAVVIGEGENTFLELLENKPLKDIKGICYKEKTSKRKEQIRFTGRREQIDINEIPPPAWDLLPIRKYKPETFCIKYTLPSIMMMTSRGCPFSCSYCAAHIMFKGVRYLSLDKTIEQIKELHYKYGIKTISFADSTFTANKKRVEEFCDLLLKNKLKIKWNIETRPDTVNYELLKKMKNAGCYYINFGVQTFNEKALVSSNRKVLFDQVNKATKMAKRLGIIVRLEFILGLPFETKTTFRDTFRKVNKMNPDFVSYYPLLILPKTPLELQGYKLPYSDDELTELALEGYKSFYYRPRYFLSRIKHVWNPVYLKRYIDCFVNF